MIPYFFRHYNGLVDRFFVYDNGSTDGSLDLLAGDERVAVAGWSVQGDSFVLDARRLCNEFWKRSRGVADWLITAEMDEHLYHPDLRHYLEACGRNGVTAIKAVGYDMIAERFPTADQPLWQTVTRGVRSFGLDKMAIFDPAAIKETNYEAGRHEASPTGRVVWEERRQVRLLHYKYLGPDYVAERNAVLSRGIRPGDLAHGWGAHYFLGSDEVGQELRALARKAAPVPGLGSHCAPATDTAVLDERELIGRSGLFRSRWYLSVYPDVARAGLDPLEHFCREGWREMRKPNAHFDPEWYRRTYAGSVGPDTNPLLDYILAGEKAGRRPAPSFDPVGYRAAHGLREGESALAHYLAPNPLLRALSRAVERTAKALRGWRRGIRHRIGRWSPGLERRLIRIAARFPGGRPAFDRGIRHRERGGGLGS